MSPSYDVLKPFKLAHGTHTQNRTPTSYTECKPPEPVMLSNQAPIGMLWFWSMMGKRGYVDGWWGTVQQFEEAGYIKEHKGA